MRYRWIGLFLLLALPITALAQTSPQVHWAQYDNTVDVLADGSLQVQEQQVVVVDRGPANGTTRTFATGNSGQVSNIQVYEDGQLLERRAGRDPGTYSGTDDGQQANIRVNFRDPNASRHTISIRYTIKRNLVADGDQANFRWNFFAQGSNMPPIQSGSVLLRFPGTVSAAQLNAIATGVPVRQTSTSNSVRWELTQPIQGQQLAVQVAFPRALLGASAQFRQPGNQPAPADPAPANEAPAPAVGGGFGFGDVVFCFFILMFLFIAFSIIRASARTRRVRGYPAPPVQDPSGTPYGRRGRRRRYGGGWGGGFGFPPIIIAPPVHPPQEHHSPFDNTPFGSGGGSSSWGDSGGGSSSWGDSGGGSSSWSDSSGGGSSWSSMGGGGSSWGGGGDSGGGGGGGDSGGSGGSSFD